MLPLTLPYVYLIVARCRETKPRRRVFPIVPICPWRICKWIDPKFTPYFLRHNRITKFSAGPKLSFVDICAWTGLSPQTIGSYMMRAGRFTKRTGALLTEEKQESLCTPKEKHETNGFFIYTLLDCIICYPKRSPNLSGKHARKLTLGIIPNRRFGGKEAFSETLFCSFLIKCV